MKIISTNIGEAREIEWNGRLVRTGIFKFPVKNPLFLESDDVVNDSVIDRKYHGGKDKACYLYSADHYQYWKKKFPGVEMPFGMFGENLTMEDLNEDYIHIGDIFEVGGATVQVSQPRQPCFKLAFRFNSDQIVKQFIDSGFPGIYVRVLKPGEVKTGDQLKLIEHKESVSVSKVFELLYASEPDPANLEKALQNTFLAESCRNDLIKRWGKSN